MWSKTLATSWRTSVRIWSLVSSSSSTLTDSSRRRRVPLGDKAMTGYRLDLRSKLIPDTQC